MLKQGRALRNSPVGYFSEEPDCWEDMEVGLRRLTREGARGWVYLI